MSSRRAVDAAALALILCACASPEPLRAPAPITLTFVLSTIDADYDDPTTPTRAHGMDLDGMIDGDPALPCTGAADFVGIRDGAAGIDDQLGLVLPNFTVMAGPEGVNGAFREAIQSGRLLVVIVVEDVDDLERDPSVRVRLTLAAAPRGALPVPDGQGLAGGASFHATEDLGTMPGAIVDGRLETTASALPLLIIEMGAEIPVLLHDVRLTGELGSGARLERGELGGTLWVSELMSYCPFIECPQRETIEALAHPDLLPLGRCSIHEDEPACTGDTDTACTWSAAVCVGGDPPGTHCEGISAGLGFEAVSGFLDETP